MRFIGGIIEKLQRHPKRIVFPEGEEPKVLQAARQFLALRLGAPILIGERMKIKQLAEELNISLKDIHIINPPDSDELELFADRFYKLRREKGLQPEEARKAMLQPHYFAAMMVALHRADGIVTGMREFGGSVLRPLLQVIKLAPDCKVASSCIIIELDDSRFGEQGVLFLADCGVIPEPTVEQLAEVAVSAARLARHLLNIRPRVALLSFSTHGSSTHPLALKVRAATALARQKADELQLQADFDGELQAHVALDPEVAKRTLTELRVAGRANVLIFPDLNSGHIASHMLQVLTRSNVYGQLLLGLDRPAAHVNPGMNVHDLVGVAAIVGVQAVDYHLLYPGAGRRYPGEDI